MSRIAPVTKDGKCIGWMFFCPACKHGHAIQTATERGIYDHGERKGDTWTFNGDQEKPTICASVLVTSNKWVPPVTAENMDEWRRAPWEQHEEKTVCHSFVGAGSIKFLGDCTHDMKDQTVPLPDWEET